MARKSTEEIYSTPENGALYDARGEAPTKEPTPTNRPLRTSAGNNPINDGDDGDKDEGVQNPYYDPNSVYMDEIQEAMSKKNYKALLNADVAAYNMKMQSKKYMDDMLRAQGLGSQGYGTSAHVGLENNAANLYAQNLSAYNEAEERAFEAAQTRKTEADEETDKQLVNYLMGSTGTKDSIAKYMDSYGYVQSDDGKWYKKDANGNPDKSQPASPYIQNAVLYASEASGNSDDQSVYNDYSFLIAPGSASKGATVNEFAFELTNILEGDTFKISEEQYEPIKNFISDLRNGNIKNGDVVHLKLFGEQGYFVLINGVIYPSNRARAAWLSTKEITEY